MKASFFSPRDVVLCRDCMDMVGGLPALRPKSVDLVLTDPPYGAHTHAKRWSGSARAHEIRHRHKGPQPAPIAFPSFSADDVQRIAAQLVRVCRGWALVFADEDLAPLWKRELIAAGAERRVTMVWTKPNGTPQFRGEGPAQPCEFIVTAWCGEGASVWNGGGKLGHYHVPVERAELRRHETQKPLMLIRQLILDFSAPGQLVLDPFGGGGQTAVAARELGRSYLLYERVRKDAEIARAAVAGVREQLELAHSLHRARVTAFGGARNPKFVQEALFE